MPDLTNNQRKVIFLHIPKTAGTTFYDCLKQIYGKNSIIEIHGDLSKNKDFLKNNINQKINQNINCIKGHMSFGLHNFLDESATYITFVRNPIARTISIYKYLQNSKNHIQHKIVKNISLKDFVLTNTLHNNGQTRFLAGKWDEQLNNIEQLNLAKQNIDKYFSVVGITEKFDESLLLLKKELQWQKMPLYIKENTTKNISNTTTDMDTLKIIKEHNEIDMKLYSYAVEKFETQIKRYPNIFEKDLQNFEFLNRIYYPLGKIYSLCRSIYVNNKIYN